MNRTHFFTFYIACLFSISNATGQQVFQSKHYGGPGTIYLYNRIAGILPFADLTASGPDQTWDLSEFNALNTHANEIVTPSSAIDQFTFLTICALSGVSPLECFGVWSSTDQALLLRDSISLLGLTLNNLQRYQEKTNSQLLENFFGFTVDFNGTPTTAVIVYQDPDLILQFPVEYEDSWTSHINWALDLSATGMNIMYSSDQTRTTEVDAWGDVITPFDTFTNVIRVRSEIHHLDSLATDTITIPVDITQVEYMWYDTAYKLPVLIATGIKTDSIETINLVQYIYEATCPTPTWTVDSGEDVYYLDANGSVNVDFIVSQDNADEFTWDFADGETAITDGTTTHTYNLAGTYAVAVSGCMTNCLPLNTCTFAIIDFEIIDTITSVNIVPGEELGIKLFPNPANNNLTIDIPVILGNQQYQIIDITGRQCMNGYITAGKSTISTQALQEGVYTINLYDALRNTVTMAIMRFVVAH
ncbi:MAG: T9SS type A sorting domain-containing protein [Bacteroidota bacterium]|nr:T9SS type A sorting domain-containing protein [Bacteroidota bacterium]